MTMTTTNTTVPTGTIAPPVAPPIAWFADPKLDKVTPFTVDKDGRVYGHLASFAACHTESTALGEACVRAPRSRTAYAGFHLGVLTTAEGKDIPVGHVVAGAPHADPVWGLDPTLVHYSHSGWVGADVRAGEDRWGIWIAGALRPDITPAQLRALKASPLSGDWRTDPSTNALELVAALAVNSPGFKVPRPLALIASTGIATSLFGVGAVGRDIAAVRNRVVGLKLQVLGMQVEGFRRGAGLPVAPPKPRPVPRRNLAELQAKVAAVHDSALVASMSAPAAPVQAWQGTIGSEGKLTGDGRLIAMDALQWAAFPLPLRWVAADVGGHDGAVVVGKIDSISRGNNGRILAKGVIDLGSPQGQEVARLIAGGFLSGVSMDLDTVDSTTAQVTTLGKAGPSTQPASVTSAGRVRGATIVQIPAFDEARIGLVGKPTNAPPTLPAVNSGAPEDSGDDSGSFASNCGCGDTVTT